MSQFKLKKTAQKRLTKGVNILVQLTFVVYSMGFGFFTAPLQAQAVAAAPAGVGGLAAASDDEAAPQTGGAAAAAEIGAGDDVTPVPNPTLPEACGLDIALVIDGSGSIGSWEYGEMMDAFKGFVNTLLVVNATPTQMSITEFASLATVRESFTGDASTLLADLNGPRSQPGGEYTNWDQGLEKTMTTFDPRVNPNLVLFASDGNPNRYGDPAKKGWSLDEVLNPAISKANELKTTYGARIVALGIGTGGSATFIDNLKAVSGPKVYGTDTNNIAEADVIMTDFDKLADDLAAIAIAQCGGTVTVQKFLDGAKAEGWKFSADATDGTPDPAVAWTDSEGLINFHINDINGTATVTITEASDPEVGGYALADASCTKNGNATGTFDDNAAAVEGIAVGPNDIVTCTFENVTETGALRVTKVVQGGKALPSDFGFRLDPNDDFTSPTGQDDSVLFDDIMPGTYSVEETGPPNYHPLSTTCTDVEVTANETTDCTITNARDTGRLIIRKQDEYGNPLDVEIDVTGAEYHRSDVRTGADGEIDFDEIPTDTYTVTESSPDGYSAGTWECTVSGDVPTVTNGSGSTLNADVLFGRTTTCTFTNTRDTGTLTVVKEVKNTNGGTASEDAFTLHIMQNGSDAVPPFPGNATGTTYTLPTGTYTVSESVPLPEGYEQTNIVCDGKETDTVTIGKDEEKTCTITNSDIPGTIYGYKYDADDEEINGWEICLVSESDDGTEETAPGAANVGRCVLTGSQEGWGDGYYEFTDLPQGTYTVRETAQGGWTATDPASGEYTGVELALGESVQLDFVNFENGDINGQKFNDFNGNGKWDDGETALAGWTIELWTCNPSVLDADRDGDYGLDDAVRFTAAYEAKDVGGADANFDGIVNEGDLACAQDAYSDRTLTPVATDITNENGFYSFQNLGPGTYMVTEVQQEKWEQTAPESGHYIIQMQQGTTFADRIFGNRELFPDFTITKDDGLASANPGETLTYNIVVANTGEYKADGIVVLDTLPDNVTYLSDTAGAAVSQVGNTLSWDFPSLTLDAGETFSFSVTVQIDSIMPFGTTTLTNAIAVSTESVESDYANNSDKDDTDVTASPLIAVVKSDTPDPVDAGGTLTYTVDWSVTGNAAATNVTLVDALDANTTFVSASGGGVYDANAHTVSWTIGSVTPAASGSVTLTVSVVSPLDNGTVLTNTVTIDSNENAPVTDTETTTVVSAPELSIVKTVNQTAANPGNTITYTVTVANSAAATAAAENVTISDTLPAGFTLASNSLPHFEASVGDLAPGASATVSFDVVIGTDVAAGTYVNTAVGDAGNSDPVEDTANIDVRIPTVLGVETAATLTVDKTVDKEAVNAEGLLLYTVNVTNVGDATAMNVVVTDTLPQGFTFVADGATTKTFALGDLKPNHSRSITYQVKVAADAPQGEYDNIAVASADNAPSVAAEAGVQVREGRVLAATGAGTLEYAIGILALLLFGAGTGGLVLRFRMQKLQLQKNA